MLGLSNKGALFLLHFYIFSLPVLPHLVWSPGHSVRATGFWDDADIAIIAHGVLAIRNLFFPPGIITVIAFPWI